VNIARKIINLDELRLEQSNRPRVSIVIDGPSLAYAFNDVHAANAFF